jgi:hypothetical protein
MVVVESNAEADAEVEIRSSDFGIAKRLAGWVEIK